MCVHILHAYAYVGVGIYLCDANIVACVYMCGMYIYAYGMCDVHDMV